MNFIKHRGGIDLENMFPRLDEWLKIAFKRPAWKRGLGRGNGFYDLGVFPKRAVPPRMGVAFAFYLLSVFVKTHIVEYLRS